MAKTPATAGDAKPRKKPAPKPYFATYKVVNKETGEVLDKESFEVVFGAVSKDAADVLSSLDGDKDLSFLKITVAAPKAAE